MQPSSFVYEVCQNGLHVDALVRLNVCSSILVILPCPRDICP